MSSTPVSTKPSTASSSSSPPSASKPLSTSNFSPASKPFTPTGILRQPTFPSSNLGGGPIRQPTIPPSSGGIPIRQPTIPPSYGMPGPGSGIVRQPTIPMSSTPSSKHPSPNKSFSPAPLSRKATLPPQTPLSALPSGPALTPLITVLGSLNIDLTSYVKTHPAAGETLTASSFNISPGGKGANQAIACAKLSRSRTFAISKEESAHIRMLGAVGSDAYGEQLLRNLSMHGVDVAGVAVRFGDAKNSKTGVALIVVEESSGENRIILSPEANHSLLPDQFKTLPGPRPDLLVMQLEIPLETVVQALATARAAGIDCLLNPAPAATLPDAAYKGLAHLVLNETEAAALGGVEESDLQTEGGLAAVAQGFLDKGVKTVIVTLGGRGVFYLNEQGEQGIVPAEKAKVVDTTAAGDTFVGAYALEVVNVPKKEFDIDAAVRRANKAAAKTVEKLGAQDSIPWRDEL